MWNGTQNTLNYFGVSQLTADQRETTGFIFEGVKEDGTVNNIPVDFANPANGLENIYWQRYGIAGVAEDAIQDASWFRLRNVSLTFNMPEALLHNIHIYKLSLSVYANNLWLSTKYTGVDPETNYTGDTNGFGLDYFNMPNYKTYGVKLNIKF